MNEIHPLAESDRLDELRKLRGIVAITCTTGLVTSETHISYSNLRDWNTRNGFLNVEYDTFPAILVETGRDNVCVHALKNQYDWLLMIDGDAAGFPGQSLARMLQIAYITQPWVDVLGAYCQLKGDPPLPTIDTGTGRWQPEAPGQGTLEVIRTGGHFLLVKTQVLTRFGPPWFRSRTSDSPLASLRNIDNFARCNLDGKNPLSEAPEWQKLVDFASGKPSGDYSIVGEDSGFCDRVRAHGGRIAVDTDLVVGHVSKHLIQPSDLTESLRRYAESQYQKAGINAYY